MNIAGFRTFLLITVLAFLLLGQAHAQTPAPGGGTKPDAKPPAAQPAGEEAAAGSAEDMATVLFDEGNRLYKEEKWEAAYEKLSQSWTLRQSFDTAAFLGHCELKLGRPRDAAEHLDYALLRFPMTAARNLKDHVTSWLAEAKKQVQTISVVVDVDGAEVRIDDTIVGTSHIEADLFVEPGQHTLTVSKEGYVTHQESFVATAGEIAGFDVELVKAPDPVVDEGGPMWEAAAPLLALGAAGVVVGGVLVGLASGKASAADSKLAELKQLPGLQNPDRPCDPAVAGCKEIYDLRTEHDNLTNAGLGPLIGGGAILIGTLVYVAVSEATRGGDSSSVEGDSVEGDSAWLVVPLLGMNTAGAAVTVTW